MKCSVCGEDMNLHGMCGCNNYTHGWSSETISKEDMIKWRLEQIKKEIERLEEEKRQLEMGIYIDKVNFNKWVTYDTNACSKCSNNPKNGGNGICNCTLGSNATY